MTANVYNFPSLSSSFVGREEEIEQVVERLSNTHCRLMTLVGLGGAGKTRLAIEVASRIRQPFADGIYFVPLQAVTTASYIPGAIAAALQEALAGQDEPILQLLRHLQNREMLLVLDNFEHLLDGAGLVHKMIEAVPTIKFLVTSREALKLSQEWLWHVRGLSYPSTPTTPQAAELAAVQLFTARAKQVKPDFSLQDEREAVFDLCRLAEGMPLTLELAASWVNSLSCTAIVAEIKQNLAFLTSTLRNVPLRHHSIQAVFDHSWTMLNEEERCLFRRLAVFRGGFARAGATHIAQATPLLLDRLVDKSLLRRETSGRYQIHELLRQYAEEQLIASGQVASARTAHCSYYTSYLQQRNRAMNGGSRQLATLAEIEEEFENIHAAWQWAVEQKQVEKIQEAADSLYLFYQFKSRYREAAAAFEDAVAQLHNCDSLQAKATRAELLVHLGWLYIRLGRLSEAEHLLCESDKLYEKLAVLPPPTGMATDPRIPLATCALIQGQPSQAKQLGEAVRVRALHHHDTGNLMFARYVLANAAMQRGEYADAAHHAQATYELAQAAGNEWFAAYSLITRGDAARIRGDAEQALKDYQASYAIRARFQDREGMGLALSRLGEIALQQKESSKAVQLLQRSLLLYNNLGDQAGLANVLSRLAQAISMVGDDWAAQRYFYQGLTAAKQAENPTLILTIMAGVAEWLVRRKLRDEGLDLYAYVLDHSSGSQEFKNRILTSMSTQGIARNEAIRSAPSDPAPLEERLQQLLAALAPAPLAPEATAQVQPTMVESLTPRELQVLRLMADGLSNQQIAQELVLAIGTVKTHVHRICAKLGADNRTQAVALARQYHLL